VPANPAIDFKKERRENKVMTRKVEF
jgi:hypothetical protein